jgi:hypothetical protein
MSDTTELAKLVDDPLTWIAATIFLHTLTGLIQTIKLKPKLEIHHNAHTVVHTEQLTSLCSTVGELAKIITEVAKTVSDIASTQVDFDESEELVVKELEKLVRMVTDLTYMYKDSDSKFSNVKVIQMLHEVKLTLEGMKR